MISFIMKEVTLKFDEYCVKMFGHLILYTDILSFLFISAYARLTSRNTQIESGTFILYLTTWFILFDFGL